MVYIVVAHMFYVSVSGCFPFTCVLTLVLNPCAYVIVTVLVFDSLGSQCAFVKIDLFDIFFIFKLMMHKQSIFNILI